MGLLPAAVARAEPLAGAGDLGPPDDGGPPRDLAEDRRLVDPEPRGDLPEGPAVQDACLDDDAVGEVEAGALAALRPFCLLTHSRLLSEAWRARKVWHRSGYDSAGGPALRSRCHLTSSIKEVAVHKSLLDNTVRRKFQLDKTDFP